MDDVSRINTTSIVVSTKFEHLLSGQKYLLYDEVRSLYAADPGHTATYVGMGLYYGNRVAVFQSEGRDDPENDFGGLILLPEDNLNESTSVLPTDPKVPNPSKRTGRMMSELSPRSLWVVAFLLVIGVRREA